MQGIPYKNFDDKHKILLFEGTDMWNLTFTKALDLGSERVIDPTVITSYSIHYTKLYESGSRNTSARSCFIRSVSYSLIVRAE